MAIVQVSVLPVGTATPSISNEVNQSLKPLQEEKDVKYQLNSMGTVLEGELGKVMEIVKRMHEGGFGEGVQRVHTIVMVDDRRDKPSNMSIPL